MHAMLLVPMLASDVWVAPSGALFLLVISIAAIVRGR
jgi:hypothetical protein